MLRRQQIYRPSAPFLFVEYQTRHFATKLPKPSSSRADPSELETSAAAEPPSLPRGRKSRLAANVRGGTWGDIASACWRQQSRTQTGGSWGEGSAVARAPRNRRFRVGVSHLLISAPAPFPPPLSWSLPDCHSALLVFCPPPPVTFSRFRCLA